MQKRLKLTPTQLAALCLVLLLSFAASLGMAFNLDAIVVSFNTSDTIAGMVASTEMAGIAMGTLLLARMSNHLDPHRVYWLGALTIVVANFASIIAPDAMWLAFSRVPAGFALGAVSATVMATAGRSERPEMTFGIIVASMGGMGVFIAFVLPRALNLYSVLPDVHPWSVLDGLYIVYIFCSLSAVLFIRLTPSVDASDESIAAIDQPVLHISGWVALIGLSLIVSGHGLLAIFLVKVGRALHLLPEVIGYVFMGASLFGIVLPIAVGYLASRIASRISIAISCAILVAAGLIVANTQVVLVFFVIAPLFAVIPSAIFPVFLGALSRLDPTGRLVAANQAFIMVGAALAPFIGGALSDYGGFSANGWVLSGFVVVGLLLSQSALGRADRLRSETGLTR